MVIDKIVDSYDEPDSDSEEKDFIYETLPDDGLIKIDEQSSEESDEDMMPPTLLRRRGGRFIHF